MIRIANVAALLAVIAVPVVGWFSQGWSGATTLIVYWFETALGCALIALRIRLHQRWSPRLGHFRYRPPTESGYRTTGSFVGGFAVTSSVFTLAHAAFLGMIIYLLHRNGDPHIADVSWDQVRIGCLAVAALLILDAVIDLATLRRWSFWQIEQTAQRGLSRIVVVHLTLIFGMAGIAVTGAPSTLFSVFVVLKTMASLSTLFPQWEPVRPGMVESVPESNPNAHPGERFEEFWAKDRVQEQKRRERNEQAWP